MKQAESRGENTFTLSQFTNPLRRWCIHSALECGSDGNRFSNHRPPRPTAMMMPRSLPSLPEAVLPATRVFHNAYPCLVRGSKSELAKNRDAAAFTEMMAALSPRGHRFESMIFNYAQTGGADSGTAADEFRFLRQDDLILMVTRPPLHDHTAGDRKYVPQSGTPLERRIFDAVSDHLRICSRARVRLQERLVTAWEQGRGQGTGGESRSTQADFKFCQNCDARLKSWNTLDLASRARRVDHAREYRSLGCFIHVPHIEEFGCRLIVSFGMGSLENLIWNRIVRTRFDRWLDAPVFALAEMDLSAMPQDPVTMHFANDIPVKLLMEVPGERIALSA